MKTIEQLQDWLSKELSRLLSQFRLMLLSIGVGIVAGLGAILFDRLLTSFAPLGYPRSRKNGGHEPGV